MLNDLISDSVTRLRNASLRRLENTTLMYSKSVERIMAVFQQRGYIESYKVVEDGNKKTINVVLKYDEKGKPAINEIKRISKPGRRVYLGYQKLKRFKNGYGIIVVSTSKGVIDNEEAYKNRVGGEALCSIW